MKFRLLLDGEEHDAEVAKNDVTIDEKEFKVDIEKKNDYYVAKVGDKEYSIRAVGSKVYIDNTSHYVEIRGAPFVHVPPDELEKEPKELKIPMVEGEVKPPMTGKVVSIEVEEGDEVEKGALLITLEAMKMQNEILSPKKGKIKKILVDVGAVVSSDDVMVVVE